MIFLFWTFLFLIFYTYAGYPCVLWLWAKYRKCPVVREDITPGVSVVIAAWNEQEVIKRRITNLLEQEYPEGKLEILIGTDGCDDKTVKYVESFDDPRVKLCSFYARRGKVSVLNDLLAKAQHEIIVFADCRQTFDMDAIRQLVSNFTDPKVGCVSGELVLSDAQGTTGKGINLYWTYEKMMRARESAIHSMVGATGAIYAIRREVFEKIPLNVVLDDMYTPLIAVRKGFRAIYDDRAKAYDKVAEDPKEETRRKVRTLFGNYQIYGLFPDLFIPLKSPIALQFFSHKMLRVLAPFFLIMIVVLNISLADQAPVYHWLIWAQVVFYGMAFLGAIFRNETQGLKARLKNICYVPYVFCLLNFSAFLGFIRYIFNDQDVMWDKAREIQDNG